MQIHSTAQTSNRHSIQASCAHGYAGGCPICNSGGGGGGGAAKKNTTGLMTWGEAWAVWNSIQVNKARQADYLKGVAANQARIQQEILANNNRMPATLLSRLMQPALPVLQSFSQMLANSGRALERTFQGIQQPLQTILQRLSANVSLHGIADRLAAMLGDGKKLLDDILQHNLETIKRRLARLQFAERLAQVKELAEKVLQAIANEAARQLQELKQRMIRAWEGIKHWFSGSPRQKQAQSQRK